MQATTTGPTARLTFISTKAQHESGRVLSFNLPHNHYLWRYFNLKSYA